MDKKNLMLPVLQWSDLVRMMKRHRKLLIYAHLVALFGTLLAVPVPLARAPLPVPPARPVANAPHAPRADASAASDGGSRGMRTAPIARRAGTARLVDRRHHTGWTGELARRVGRRPGAAGTSIGRLP